MEDDLVFVEKNQSDEGIIIPPQDVITSLLKENNDLIKKYLKLNFKSDVEIFFLPNDAPWPFDIEIPVSSNQSYPNIKKNNIINLVTRALALMSHDNQIKCRDGNFKQRQLLVKYVNKLYNIEINSKIFG